MESANIQELISGKGFIMVNKGLAKMVGLNAATIYGELVSTHLYWKGRSQLTEHNDLLWFYCTIEDLEDKTTLKRSIQDKAIKELEKEGLIKVDKFGLPAKRYFHITDKYIKMLVTNYFVEKQQTDNTNGSHGKNSKESRNNKVVEKQQTGVTENNKLDSRKSTTNNKAINKKEFNKEKDIYKESNPLKDILYDWLNED